jgi:hypothetical protein
MSDRPFRPVLLLQTKCAKFYRFLSGIHGFQRVQQSIGGSQFFCVFRALCSFLLAKSSNSSWGGNDIFGNVRAVSLGRLFIQSNFLEMVVVCGRGRWM